MDDVVVELVDEGVAVVLEVLVDVDAELVVTEVEVVDVLVDDELVVVVVVVTVVVTELTLVLVKLVVDVVVDDVLTVVLDEIDVVVAVLDDADVVVSVLVEVSVGDEVVVAVVVVVAELTLVLVEVADEVLADVVLLVLTDVLDEDDVPVDEVLLVLLDADVLVIDEVVVDVVFAHMLRTSRTNVHCCRTDATTAATLRWNSAVDDSRACPRFTLGCVAIMSSTRPLSGVLSCTAVSTAQRVVQTRSGSGLCLNPIVRLRAQYSLSPSSLRRASSAAVSVLLLNSDDLGCPSVMATMCDVPCTNASEALRTERPSAKAAAMLVAASAVSSTNLIPAILASIVALSPLALSPKPNSKRAVLLKVMALMRRSKLATSSAKPLATARAKSFVFLNAPRVPPSSVI